MSRKCDIPYKDWPKEIKEYKNYQRRLKRNPELAGLSAKEKKQKQLERLSKAREIWKEKYSHMSLEEKKENDRKKGSFYHNASDEKKKEYNNRLRKISVDFWDSMDEKQRKEFGEYRWNQKSDEEKQKTVQRFMEGGRKYRDKLSYEEKCRLAAIAFQNYQNRRREDPKFVEEQNELLKKHCKEYWDNITPEEKECVERKKREFWKNASEELKEKMSKSCSDRNRRWWDSRTEDQLKEISNRFKIFNKEYWTKERRGIHSNKMSQRWDSLSEEDKIKHMKSRHVYEKKSSLHKKFESYFHESYINNHFYYVSEDIFSKDGVTHSWDYGIYDENGTLQMLVDIDGAFYHGDNKDYNGLHSQEEYDERRFLTVPDGVKYHIIYEKEWTKSFEAMIKLLLDKSYNEFVEDMFTYCRNLPDLPYVHYTDAELLKSYHQLVRLNPDKYHNNISINNREGDRIINHFHHSIYSAKCKGFKLSPYEAWYNDKLLLKIIKNRIIYINKINPNKILQGFNIAKVAKRVTVFSAGRAKLLISRYLNEFDTVFDPFSGFSGRMLGTIASGKKYIGQDLSDIHIRESQQIVDFLKSYGESIDVELYNINSSESKGEYPCLFTCPPYADKEQWLGVRIDMRTCDDWIDICLKNFKCKKYLFVVDTTERYKDYITDQITNKSHMNKNQEHIVFIEK